MNISFLKNSMCEYEKVRHKNIEKTRLIESLQIQKVNFLFTFTHACMFCSWSFHICSHQHQDRAQAKKGSVMPRITLRLAGEYNIKHYIKLLQLCFVPLIVCKIPVCKVQKTSRCSYDVKPVDLQKEQEAFQAGEGVRIIIIFMHNV